MNDLSLSTPHQRLYHGAMQFSDVSTGAESQPHQPYYLPLVEEEVEISDSMAVVSVPPPRFRSGDPAYILHDFNRVRAAGDRSLSRWCSGSELADFTRFCFVLTTQKLTAYLDLTLRTCFVIPLNTSVVLPPQDLIDLFSQLMVSDVHSVAGRVAGLQ